MALILASCMYYAECDANDKFDSIPHSLWFVIITMTTVGYGDEVPVTSTGKFIGMVTAIGGVLTIALTLPAIVFEFTNIYHKDVKNEVKSVDNE